MAIHSCVDSFNFAHPANIRKVHGILMIEVRNEAAYISNKYKIQKEPMQLKWNKFLPTQKKRIPAHSQKYLVVTITKNTNQILT